MTAVDGRAGQGGAGRGRAGQVSARANLQGWTQPAAACRDQTTSRVCGLPEFKGSQVGWAGGARRRLRGAGGREGPTPGRAVSADPRGSGTGLGSLWAKVNVGRTET